MTSDVRLSQCMIVKNEEKNIENALAWGKEIVCEQIVVDTGSTDRTVELAEAKGASVYHFPWADDFSAAKNFAIEKASGEWIAFLDADEFFSKEDAEALYDHLCLLKDSGWVEKPHIIQCAWIQLDDGGKASVLSRQTRIFRNLPQLRYRNRIHENLQLLDGSEPAVEDMSDTLSIYHTGYAGKEYQEKGKALRNISILQKEVYEHPENFDAWSYLGTALMNNGQREEALAAYEKVISRRHDNMMEERRNVAFCNTMKLITEQNSSDIEETVRELYKSFQECGAFCPDMEYHMGRWMAENGRTADSIYWLEKALEILDLHPEIESPELSGNLGNVYRSLFTAYLEKRQAPRAVKFGVLALRCNRFQKDVLPKFLRLLREDDPTTQNAENVLRFLTELYDLSALRDRLFILNAAKAARFSTLEKLVYALFSDQEKEWLRAGSRAEWYLTEAQCREKYPDIVYYNETDRAFFSLMEKMGIKTQKELQKELITRLRLMSEKDRECCSAMLGLLRTGKHWGMLEPDWDIYESFSRRIRSIQENRQSLTRLYGRLCDTRSRKAMLAVLNNWLMLDTRLLKRVADRDLPCFDTDLIPSGEGEVYVDVGSGEGRSVIDFMETYGKVWRHIYCYEPSPEAFQKLKGNLEDFPRITLNERLAGNGDSKATLNPGDNDSRYLTVQVSSVDDDIAVPVSFIRLDACGREIEALAGCRRHIAQEHPKLAVCVHYGFEEIYRIPELILEMDPSYRFYLRYYGEDYFPTYLILYAL